MLLRKLPNFCFAMHATMALDSDAEHILSEEKRNRIQLVSTVQTYDLDWVPQATKGIINVYILVQLSGSRLIQN